MRYAKIWLLILAVGLAIVGGLLLGDEAWSGPAAAAPEAAIRWPHITLASPIDGLDYPVHIAHAGDGSGRLFVVEQEGRIRIVKAGVLLATPFLDIQSRVSCCGERGLLSVAFPANYATQGSFYVDYTNLDGQTVVARYGLTSDPDVADPNSEEIVLAVDQPYPNHNGGQLAFGPKDGYLYIGLGDGGGAGDPEDHAQNPASLLGKLLRIDVEAGDPLTYTIPATNPYTQTVGYRDEIWALGLRNPWRFSFDRQTGDLYVGDVGQYLYEEVNYQPASSSGGENYGWNIMEGFHCYKQPTCDQTGLTLPIVEYEHTQGRCSVTGGAAYRGQQPSLMQGIYFYADYCSGGIWGLTHDGTAWQNTLLLDADFRITSFGEDESGALWITEHDGAPTGAIHRLAEIWALFLPVILR